MLVAAVSSPLLGAAIDFISYSLACLVCNVISRVYRWYAQYINANDFHIGDKYASGKF